MYVKDCTCDCKCNKMTKAEILFYKGWLNSLKKWLKR